MVVDRLECSRFLQATPRNIWNEVAEMIADSFAELEDILYDFIVLLRVRTVRRLSADLGLHYLKISNPYIVRTLRSELSHEGALENFNFKEKSCASQFPVSLNNANDAERYAIQLIYYGSMVYQPADTDGFYELPTAFIELLGENDASFPEISNLVEKLITVYKKNPLNFQQT